MKVPEQYYSREMFVLTIILDGNKNQIREVEQAVLVVQKKKSGVGWQWWLMKEAEAGGSL